MRYPNLRYGTPAMIEHYLLFYSRNLAGLARELRRDERTVRDWISGRTKVPWWVPELLRLRIMEHTERVRQMTGKTMAARVGIVQPSGQVVDAGVRFAAAPPPPPASLPPLLRDMEA